jgi:hypothetical protein
VEIMDFGLTQLSDHTKLTASGMKLGTPAYMARTSDAQELGGFRRGDAVAIIRKMVAVTSAYVFELIALEPSSISRTP